jgi:hypothetical protein
MRTTSAMKTARMSAATTVTSAPRQGRGGTGRMSEDSGSGGTASSRYSAGGSASPVT